MHGPRCPHTSFRASDAAEHTEVAEIRRKIARAVSPKGAPAVASDPCCPYTSRPFAAGVPPVRPELDQIMYAVISTGGKQYRVSEGSVVRVEKLTAEAGANVEFDKVLLVGQGDSVKIGSPFLSGGKVVATVQSHGKGDKVRIVKFRRRKH